MIDGARIGTWTGGFFGILAGAAFLIVPRIGPLVIAGPLAATLLGGIEGAIAGSAVGALAGALVSLGFSKNEAILYESQIKAGKFLVTLKGIQKVDPSISPPSYALGVLGMPGLTAYTGL